MPDRPYYCILASNGTVLYVGQGEDAAARAWHGNAFSGYGRTETDARHKAELAVRAWRRKQQELKWRKKP